VRILRSCRRGQARLIEAALAALVLFVGLSLVSFLVGPMNTLVIEPRGELEKRAYNTLYRLSNAGVYEETIMSGDPYSEDSLKSAISRLLSPHVHYNLTIYNATQVDPISVNMEKIVTVTNLEEGSPVSSEDLFVVCVRAPYTTRSGSVLVFTLALGSMGQGEE